MDRRVIEELKKLKTELCKVDAAIYFCELAHVRMLISKREKEKDLVRLSAKRKDLNNKIANLQVC